MKKLEKMKQNWSEALGEALGEALSEALSEAPQRKNEAHEELIHLNTINSSLIVNKGIDKHNITAYES